VTVGRGGIVGVGRGVESGVGAWVGRGGVGVTSAQATGSSSKTVNQGRKGNLIPVVGEREMSSVRLTLWEENADLDFYS
jgi:hypothetical protein